MRISTQQQYLQTIDTMQRGQVNLDKLNQQISTGKKLITPSDNPVAAAQVVKLERELAQYNKFDDNINVTQRRLELEETILGDVNIAIDRMRELAIQAGNGVLGDQDRKALSQELYQLKDYVAGLMNTRDSEGEYLFAGSQGSTKPYTETSNGRYQYNGDDGQRMIQVGSDLYMPSNDSGQFLFESVEGPLQVSLTGQAVYDANLANVDPFVSQVAFADKSAEESFKTAIQGLGDLSVTVNEPTPGSYTYTISDSGGNAQVSAASFTPGEPIDFNGMTFNLGVPTDPADPLLNTIHLTASTEKRNILDAAIDLAEVLAKPIATGESRSALSEAIATGLEQFKQAAEQTLEARTTLGSRLKTLEYSSSSNLDFKLITNTALSLLVDANLDEVISQFKLQEVTLQASQATFGRMSSLSLFNYIS